MKKYIAFDVGGTKIKHGLLLENGQIITKDSYDTQRQNVILFLEDMVRTITQYEANEKIEGIAISLPGFINSITGFSENAGSIEALHHQNLKELLQARIDLPVTVENDGNCAALAEKWSGNAQECSQFVCMTIGTGIGGGIFVNGQILHGHRFRGGEFGYMFTKGEAFSKGNMHFNASTSALINSYKKIKGIDEAEKVQGETVFLEATHDREVEQLIEEWFENLSYGIFNLAVTLNPEKILIGGGVSMQESLIEEITNKLNLIPWWKELKVPLDRCKHRNDAGMIGALYHLKQQLN